MKTTIIQSVNEEPSGGDAIQYIAEKARVRDQLKEAHLKIRKEHQNTQEREYGGLEETTNANAIATNRHAAESFATKPTTVNQLSDDDAAAKAAVKGFDGVIGKKKYM